MQRTFITTLPSTVQDYQAVIDLPRYEAALAHSFLRRDFAQSNRFADDDAKINVLTTLNNIKSFVDELSLMDTAIADSTRSIPYTNYVGLQFDTSGAAVKWARTFVQHFFPATEERLLKRQLLTLPLTKTEIIWVGGERYLPFISAIATSPSSDELVQANTPSDASVAVLTPELASQKRAAIAAKRDKMNKETTV